MPQLFDLSQSEHTSLAIMLYPDPETAAVIAGREGVTERADQLHVTLLYAGDASQMADEQIAEFILATSHLSMLAGPFEANLQGVGRFDGGGTHTGEDAIYASVDSPFIETLRRGLLDHLEEYDVELPEPTHGFVPHMTLAYIPPGFDSPLVRTFETINVHFGSVSIRIGDLQADFPLSAIDIDSEERMNLQERFAAMLRSFASDIEDARQEDDIEREPVKRDTAVPIVWDAVWDHFGRLNGRLSDGDSFHWLQDLYVTNSGSMYAITVQGGKLYRSPVTTTDEGTFVGQPVQVIASFQPAEGQRSTVISRMTDGRPVFLSILATAALNKDQEIDSTSLFDAFVDRFKGDGSEYVNLYHLGKEKSRIGEFQWVGREGNVFAGIWVPDDTAFSRAVAETLESDEDGRWGNSIEFMPDNDGYLSAEDDIEFRVFDAGTFWGSSIVLNEHACSWFTANRAVKERTMPQAMQDALVDLVGDPDLVAENLAEFLRTTDKQLKESGAITRTQFDTFSAALRNSLGVEDASEGEEREQGQEDSGDEGDEGDDASELRAMITQLGEQVAELRSAQDAKSEMSIELDPDAAAGIAQAVFDGEEFRSLSSSLESLGTQLEERTQSIIGQAEGLTERVSAMEERLANLEKDEEERLRDHDEMKPRSQTLTVGWRAGRGKEDGNGNTQKTRSMADLAAATEGAWSD